MRQAYVNALCQEITTRAHELPQTYLPTIYFGGGTPSLLQKEDFTQIFKTLSHVFTFDEATEITVESNPDDISSDYIDMLRSFGVNRLSMGVQTFHQTHLKFLHRRHSKNQSFEAIKTAYKKGIQNISIDLIYGLPKQTLEEWEKDLEQAFSLPITHLSAYSLIYEEGTPLYNMRAAGKVNEAQEGLSYDMYASLLNAVEKANWEHYEISNFAQRGFYSRHNSAYWENKPYLGCGPAAHSFNGKTRRSNFPSLRHYLSHVGAPLYEEEVLTEKEKLNERLLTSLRTVKGLSLLQTSLDFGEASTQRILRLASKHIQRGQLLHEDQYLKLSKEGFFVSDDIISDLMED